MMKKLLLPMAFILPFWLVAGRGFLGSDGWLTVIYIVTVAPFLSAVLISLYFIGRKIIVTKLDQLLLAALYVAVFLHGFFVVDGTDNGNQIGSVATGILGQGFQPTSNWIGFVLFIVSFGLLVATFVRFVSLGLAARKPSLKS